MYEGERQGTSGVAGHQRQDAEEAVAFHTKSYNFLRHRGGERLSCRSHRTGLRKLFVPTPKWGHVVEFCGRDRF